MTGSFGRGFRDQVQSWADKVNELKDVYLPGREEPLMLAGDIKSGKNYDVNSGEAIETLDDITGEVKDEDGNTVVTPEEFGEGLVDSEGKSVKSGRLKQFARRYLSITTAPGEVMGRVALRAGRGAARGVARLIKGKDRDAYLPEEETPRITVQGLKRGQYFDAESGDPITTFDQIKGGVIDQDGNQVISAEERSELVTAGGKKHRAAQGALRRLLRAGTTGLVKKAAKGYWNWTKRYYKGLGKKTMGLGKRLGNKMMPGMFAGKDDEWIGDDEEEVPEDAAKTPTDGLLKRILKTLDKRLPDDEPEKGSWKSILARRKKEDAEEEEEASQGKGSLLKRLFGGVGGLLGAGGRWDEEEEEDDGDINAYGEYDGGDKDDKKNRKNKKPKSRKPKGKLGRLWQGAKSLTKGGWDKVKGLGSKLNKSKWGARALKAGRFAFGKGGMIAGGAVWAGTALAGVLSAPVVIGAAVVGAAAVGGYLYYQRRKRAAGVFRELRITQYGFSPNGWSTPGKLLDIEDVLSQGVRNADSDKPSLDLNAIDIPKLFDVADVDQEDQEELAAFVTWLDKRFKPVFLAYHHALAEIAPGVILPELDDKLPKEDGMKFLELVTFKDDENSPYLYVNDPFDPGDTVWVDMDDIKDRILEFLALGIMKGDVGGSIVLFVGPPGVGKTSLGRSIADAMGRAFYRFSVGGMRDEAEIKGHRRTYVGAMPGKLIRALREAGTSNPVIMLDEIDKLGASFQGDPASALLEVLDPEQNSGFHDHYLDVDVDLSKTLFICTANQLDSIPGPLLDRMEVIHLSGYLAEEKLEIARNHLVPRQLERAGLKKSQLRIHKAALRRIIDGYAREAGVRRLEKQIGTLVRKAVVKLLRGEKPPIRIAADDVETYLGQPLFRPEEQLRGPGIVTGLAWTAMGGATLPVEARCVHRGQRGFKLTGQLGEVMRESAEIALDHVQGNAERLGLDPDWFDQAFVHLHVPAGATPKDGPSAGVTMATALVSLARNRTLRRNLAMTGELTLTGRVYPVGGIREKLVAARRLGVKEVILPDANRRDVDEIPEYVTRGLTIHFARDLDEVLAIALP
jgi:hypothetical protein